MLSNNNSNAAICANNLLQIARGEVPYDRVKGVSFANIDSPAHSTDDLIEDAEWVLKTYEPRAEIESIEIAPTDAQNGHFAITANINTTKEADA